MPKKGFKHSEKAKEKIRNSTYHKNLKGKNNPLYGIRKFGKDNPFYGKRHSKKTKKKMVNNHADFSGSKHPNYKGGKKIDVHGYVFILKHNHPFCDKNGYIRFSHLVMEKILGRYLKPKEVVHHINRIKNDNRPENLRLFSNQSEHTKFHHFLKKHNQSESSSI